jgi:dienelactone hydrolase
MMFHVERILLALGLLWAGVAAAAGIEVHFPGPGLELVGRLYEPAESSGRRPAVVLLHGCSGMWASDTEPTRSYVVWGEHLAKHGFVALLVDSFRPRGQREICTLKDRPVLPGRDRSRDAHVALRWLAAREDIDPSRIHVLGWSHGGQTVLHALRPDAPGRHSSGPQFRSGVAFYPGCREIGSPPYRPTAPLLLQAGAADDWTPARNCEALAAEAQEGGAKVEIDVYPDAHHAFDRGGTRIRYRADVYNPSAESGRGATVGPNPAARAKSIARATAFLEGFR